MEADSLLMGGPRIKFECLRDDVSFPALSEKHLHVLQLLSDVMHELEQAGGTPILPDSKVGGNCAFRLSEKHLLVSRSSKRPFARLRVPQDFVCVTNFDEEKWKCTFCSLEGDLLPSSDTPLLWHSSAQVVVHGHGLFEEQDAAALKCPISPQETLFSTRDDLDALRKMLPAKLCIRKGHGFFLMSTEEDLVKDLRPILALLKSRQIRVFVHGFGGVGKILCDLLRKQATRSFLIVGVSDSKGFLFDRNGIDLDEVSRVKEEFGCVARNKSLLTNADILLGHVDIFFDARPFSFTDKNEVIISMLKSGTDVVFTNKAPCALMFDALVAAAQHGRSEFRFSSCVGGALPSVNMLQRDLKGCRLRRIEAILNVSTNILLRQMERQGCTLEAAIADLSSRGLLETDPSMDVDAFDSAAKIAILGEEHTGKSLLATYAIRKGNVMGKKVTLHSVKREGIRNIGVDDLKSQPNHSLVLLCLFEEPNQFSVRPAFLPNSHPLTKLAGDEMGIFFDTDIQGKIFASCKHVDAIPTAGAMIRDAYDLIELKKKTS